MKKFKFRLQKVLELREKQQEMIQQKIRAKDAEINAVRDKIYGIDSENDYWLRTGSRRIDEDFTVKHMIQIINYLKTLASQREKLLQKAGELEQEKKKMQKKLLEIKKKKEMLIRLKTRYINQYNYEASREEMKTYDEYSITKYTGASLSSI